jgi:hypothetical protein
MIEQEEERPQKSVLVKPDSGISVTEIDPMDDVN